MTGGVLDFFARNARRIGITILGFLLVVVGALLIPLPGPGWLIVFAGLTVLSREYAWARRATDWMKVKLKTATKALKRKHPS